MKKLLFVIWVACCIAEHAAHAECFQGNVVITTPESYAEADLIECIEGRITVTQNYWIPNLIFHNLKYVTGDVFIVGRNPPSIWQIGFQQLEWVGGTITIGSNQNLTNIQLGANIDSVNRFEFYGNNQLRTLRLGKLESVNFDFLVYENASLNRIIGNYLEHVGGTLEVTDNESYCQSYAEDWGYSIDASEYFIDGNEVCE